MSSSMEKNVYDRSIDSDIKQYKEITKLITGQGEDYTTGCLLDYDYVKTHYRLIAVDLSRERELDANPKAIQQIEFVGQLKILDAKNNDESVFLNNFRKNQRNKIKIFSRKCDSIINNGKLSLSESSTNKYTIKQIKICSKK